MSRLLPSRIFLLLFADRGRNFLLVFDPIMNRGETSPPGKIRAAGNEPGTALVGEIRPRPLGKNQHSVLETN